MNIKDTWLIEEPKSSSDCEHFVKGGNVKDTCVKTGNQCTKDNCPIVVK